MPYELKWKLDVEVPGGPKLQGMPLKVMIDAYDPIQVLIPAQASGQEVVVQPAEDHYPVRFLLIKASEYQLEGDTTNTLCYSVNAPSDEADKRVTLDAQQVFIGTGAASLLNHFDGKPPKKLFFYNALKKDVTIDILVGRKATEPVPAPAERAVGGGAPEPAPPPEEQAVQPRQPGG